MSLRYIKRIIAIALVLLVSGCSVVRIDTNSIDNTIKVIMSKNNTLFNQVGQGYKYYLPGGVTYIDSDDYNDILYCNGAYYYLNINILSYYYQIEDNYKEDDSLYYSKRLSGNNGFAHDGYLQITKLKDDKYYIEFMYNYALIETIVNKDELNNAVLNSSYILSTIKYNRDIIEIMLEDDNLQNKTGKYNKYNNKSDSTNFELDNDKEEG